MGQEIRDEGAAINTKVYNALINIPAREGKVEEAIVEDTVIVPMGEPFGSPIGKVLRLLELAPLRSVREGSQPGLRMVGSPEIEGVSGPGL